MNRTYEIMGNRMIAYMPRELDHHKAEELRRKWDVAIEGSNIRELIFDFSQTEFMDSSGIGVLIGRTRKIGYFGGQAYATGLNNRVTRLFLAAGLNELIPMVTLQIPAEPSQPEEPPKLGESFQSGGVASGELSQSEGVTSGELSQSGEAASTQEENTPGEKEAQHEF
ncbi:MAG: anti-sigma factor antagonist [Agathobacter sp.]|nr:anti-sigma factor antagonist [Agathobacter sp.]